MTIEDDRTVADRIRANAKLIADDMAELARRGWRPYVEFRVAMTYGTGVPCAWDPKVSITRGQPEHL